MGERKIEAMHKRFGSNNLFKCKDCEYLVKHTYDKTYYKCSLYGNSNSEATDWRVGYTACGLCNIELDLNNWIPIIVQLKHESRKTPEAPIDGQIKMEV